jgi:hypothetical protein
MNFIATAFFVFNALALLTVPRRWAPVPLLTTACYMTIGQGVEFGPFSFPVYRMVLAMGVLRVVLRGERFAGRFNTIDKLMVMWAVWVFIASFFHEWRPGSGPVYASGLIFNITLVYFLSRVWCYDLNNVINLTRIIAWLLVPVAAEMVLEHIVEMNMFSVFGGVPAEVYVREGTIRAQGPFQHPILAGTVGAVCFPLMIGVWRRHRLTGFIGVAACLVMVGASVSSGPGISVLVGLFGLAMWRFRHRVGMLLLMGVGAYLALELLMTRPAYYVISKFDLTGSSTGWHRSRLIEATFEHFDEWWLFGTDRTVHWMGMSNWSEQHADITNYYIGFAVVAGLPALLLILAIMWRAFRWVGDIVRRVPQELVGDKFMIWCFGSGLLAHAATSLSASYFDQSLIFFWLNIAVISSMHSVAAVETPSAKRSPSGLPRQDSVTMRRAWQA